MEKIKSPVTGSYNTKVLKWYSSTHFIELYKTSINIDVARFFKNCDRVAYVKCLDTGYKFFSPTTIFGDDLFYEELQTFDWYYHQEKWEFNETLKYIKSKDKVLEIGAGNGAFLNKLKNDKTLIDALEFNKLAISSLKSQGYNVYNQTIEDFSNIKENYYDAVVLFQVLEHIPDVQSFLNAAIKSLKKGGKLIISVPNNDAFIMRLDFNLCLNFPPHHQGHWDKKVFVNLQKHFHFKFKEITYEPLDEDFYSRFYRVIAIYIRKRFGILGKIMDKLIYPLSNKIVRLFSSKIKGLSLVVCYEKI
jgi:2-polyprenyl-3-methyl-5-hydroxy-6-metoxy-1,4-benzoquinol methylase